MKRAILVGLILAALGWLSPASAGPAIVAHRGASAYAPENTMPAFQLAWDLNADGVESDVYLTRDGRVMVMHDKDTARTARGSKLIMNESNSEALRTLDVGAWRGSWFVGTRIPFLEEVLANTPPGKLQVIEIKDGVPTVAPVKEIIKKSGLPHDRVAIISFKFDVCIEARRLMPDFEVYLLKDTKKNKETGEYLPYPEDMLQKVKDAGLTGVDLEYHPVNRKLVDEARALGLKFWVWTVDDEKAVEELTLLGVDAITTNVPNTARRAAERSEHNAGDPEREGERIASR
ncbi:MAG: glycerophosphodiester phosphodiesterase [Verrucomicrobiales bacterium]